MASGEELKAKAREFERAKRIPEALDVYLHLVQELEGAQAASVWERIARLQVEAGDSAAALVSGTRALDLYRSAAQKNNALAVARYLVGAGSADASVHHACLSLALDLAYPVFAREAVAPTLVLAVRGELPDDSVEDVATFLERYGSRPGSSIAELVEDLPPADEPGTASLLVQVWRILRDRESVDAADRVRAEIVRMRPEVDPLPSSPRPSAHPPSPVPSPLPLIDGTGGDGDLAGIEVPRLVGLEPTHAGLEREAAILEPAIPEQTSPASRDDGEESADSDVDDDDYVDDPLPLLIPSVAAEPGTARDARPVGREEWEGTAPENLTDLRIGTDSAGDDVAHDTGSLPPIDLAAIARELEKITTREVEPSDAASHYDVGVAFKDMGMLEDAIARLGAAFMGGHHPLATLEVLGEILVEQDRYESAARVLGFARTAGTEYDDAMVGVLYWLARSDEVRGRPADARELLTRVVRVASSFRDAAQRLEALPSS